MISTLSSARIKAAYEQASSGFDILECVGTTNVSVTGERRSDRTKEARCATEKGCPRFTPEKKIHTEKLIAVTDSATLGYMSHRLSSGRKLARTEVMKKDKGISPMDIATIGTI